MNYARSPILWVATLVLSYVLDSAAQTAPQCQLSPASAETLTAFSTQTKGSTLHRMQGLVYLEVGCFSEARALFEQSKNEALDETDISRDAQQAWAEYLIDLTQGYEAWKGGNIALAKTIFSRNADMARPQDVNTRAVFALAELLMQNPDPRAWKDLAPSLSYFVEHKFWQAKRYEMVYGFTSANAAARIASLERSLDQNLPVQQRLEDEIILEELLELAGRLTEAELLTHDIEKAVGTQAISPDLRAQYVRVRSAIEKKRADSGDPLAQSRYQKYQSALGEMYAPQ